MNISFVNSKMTAYKEYGKFKNIISEFVQFYQLDNYCFKEIDRYLWQLGKQYFN